MKYIPDTEIINGITFELRPMARHPTKPDWVCLRKNRDFINRYLELVHEFEHCRMVEVGVDQGGSTSFFTKLLQPQALLAIELSDQPVSRVMDFLAEHDPMRKVNIHWGVDQSDPIEVPRILDATFEGQPLDLVIDDASHLLIPTTATFEMLFPRLRPGGRYIIEDWSGSHLVERSIHRALLADPDGKVAKSLIAARDSKLKLEMPMSLLICQLVLAAARNPDWITEVRVTDGFCEIRRGEADIAPDTPISSYVGSIGSRMLEASPDWA